MNILPLTVQMFQTLDEVPLKKEHVFQTTLYNFLSDSDLYSRTYTHTHTHVKCLLSSSRPDNRMTKLFSQLNFTVIQTIFSHVSSTFFSTHRIKDNINVGQVDQQYLPHLGSFYFSCLSSDNIVYSYVDLRKLMPLEKEKFISLSAFCGSFILELTP